MSIEHSFLEDQLEATNDFKLDFSDINASIINENSTDLINDLNKLIELYKSGNRIIHSENLNTLIKR